MGPGGGVPGVVGGGEVAPQYIGVRYVMGPGGGVPGIGGGGEVAPQYMV